MCEFFVRMATYILEKFRRFCYKDDVVFRNSDLETRIVVTGVGMETPLGDTLSTFTNLLEGKSGLSHFTLEDDETRFPVGAILDFDLVIAHSGIPPRKAMNRDRFMILGLAAANLAYQDAGLEGILSEEDRERTGAMLGTGIGAMLGITKLLRGEPITPLSVPTTIPNMGAGNFVIQRKLLGPCGSVSTACASGNDNIIAGIRCILTGEADRMFVGASDACLGDLALRTFAASGAMTLHAEGDPRETSRPFDADHCGFVLGEGAAVLVIERLDVALARGAKIYAEIVGYASCADGHSMTDPQPSGAGTIRCITSALKMASLEPEAVSAIIAHGTGTQRGDRHESLVYNTIFGENSPKITSIKSWIGHSQGAASAVEAVVGVLMFEHNQMPGTANIKNLHPDAPKSVVHGGSIPFTGDVILSPALGFGSHCSSIVLGRYK